MMKARKQRAGELAKLFRQFLRQWARAALAQRYPGRSMAEAKQEVLKELDLSPSALESMLYRGLGGMDAWVQLFYVLSEMNPQQFEMSLAEISEIMRKKRKMSRGDLAWIQRGESLSDDKKLFWSDLIRVMEDLDGGAYTIQKRR